MKILIVPDVHGRDFWRNPVQNIEYDKVIFLGDYLDHYSYESTREHDIETLEDIINFKKSNPDKVILLIGNHDCPYIWDEYGKALGNYWCRHDYDNHDEINKLFTDNLNLFQIAWECKNEKYGKVLFTHAGVTNTFKRICGLDANEINNFFLKEKSGDMSNVVGLAAVSFYRGGDQTSGSPVWADVYEHVKSQVPDVFQIFGHTYSKKEIIMEHFAMLDTGKNCWLLNENELIKV